MVLSEQSLRIFEEHFLKLKRESAGTITTKTAAEIASSITIGIISPIASQIDPIKLGEVDRAMRIAVAYGTRLSRNTDAIYKLATDYPSHSFVIDFEEAKKVLKNVRRPNEQEQKLEKVLFDCCRKELNIVSLCPVSKEIKDEREEGNKSNQDEDRETIRSNERDNTKDEQKPKAGASDEVSKSKIEKDGNVFSMI